MSISCGQKVLSESLSSCRHGDSYSPSIQRNSFNALNNRPLCNIVTPNFRHVDSVFQPFTVHSMPNTGVFHEPDHRPCLQHHLTTNNMSQHNFDSLGSNAMLFPGDSSFSCFHSDAMPYSNCDNIRDILKSSSLSSHKSDVPSSFKANLHANEGFFNNIHQNQLINQYENCEMNCFRDDCRSYVPFFDDTNTNSNAIFYSYSDSDRDLVDRNMNIVKKHNNVNNREIDKSLRNPLSQRYVKCRLVGSVQPQANNSYQSAVCSTTYSNNTCELCCGNEISSMQAISTKKGNIFKNDNEPISREKSENPTNTQHKRSVKDSSKFMIDISKVKSHEDCRQFLMIKNIPNSITQEQLLDILNNYVKERIEFLYLPVDMSTGRNLGIGYVSLTDVDDVYVLYCAMHLKTWPDSRSKKTCELVYARIQGHRDYVKMCKNWTIMKQPTKNRPIFFTKVKYECRGVIHYRSIRASFEEVSLKSIK